jgi:hypothetical protein
MATAMRALAQTFQVAYQRNDLQLAPGNTLIFCIHKIKEMSAQSNNSGVYSLLNISKPVHLMVKVYWA